MRSTDVIYSSNYRELKYWSGIADACRDAEVKAIENAKKKNGP